MSKRKRKIVVFLGPQGSGKGTQAEILARRIGLPAISTGGLYRREISRKTPIGRLAAGAIKRGLLAPEELTISLVSRRLSKPDAREGAVLDGFPRTLVQVKAMERIARPTRAIIISVPDKVALERISGRRVCSRCGENFHLKYRPPRKRGVCDRCGGKLIRRADDDPRAVRRRLRIYHRETEPVIREYGRQGLLVEIDGRGTVEDVAREVWRAFLRRQKSKSKTRNF